MKVYYDGTDAILGRIGSIVCKDLLKGREVVLINSEKIIISGDKQKTKDEILWWRNLGARSQKGPKSSKHSDKLVKRMIRGMLPWDRPKGREAYKRLRCYIGNGNLTDNELKMVKKIKFNRPIKYISIEEISKTL